MAQRRLRRAYKTLVTQLKPLERRNAQQKAEIEKLTQVLHLKTEAAKGISQLFEVLQERLRQIAMQILALNSLLAKLLSDESGDNKMMREVQNIAQKNNVLLKQLVKGYPIVEDNQAIEFASSFNKVQKLFLSEFIERELTLKTVGKIKERIDADQLLCELVLYHLFHRIIDRQMKGGMIKIQFKNTPHLQIIFYDNGFERETAEPIQNPSSNMWSLSKTHLQELAYSLGWQLTFAREKRHFYHATTLFIPKPLKAGISTNVVRLFARKKPIAEERKQPS